VNCSGHPRTFQQPRRPSGGANCFLAPRLQLRQLTKPFLVEILVGEARERVPDKVATLRRCSLGKQCVFVLPRRLVGGFPVVG